MLLFIILHRPTIRGERIDCLFLANIYIILLVISCFFLDMYFYYITGYLYPNSSFDNLWCRTKGYILYICGYSFFHSFSLQAIYRICRILYPIQTKRQPFNLYAIIFLGQWIFSAIELLPSLLIGDIEYLENDFHCQVAPTNMRSSLTVCLIGFLAPFTIILYCYGYTIYYVRKHNSTIITIKQRTILRRDLIILKRIILLLTVLTSSAVPHVAFPIIYIMIGSLPKWLVSLEWALTILALLSISLVIPRISPHLKRLRAKKRFYKVSITQSQSTSF
ncbi:unnamed protein product [Adineta steineri]|uniref:G-protein coupled receptors family 1 profile domain-containing protein n=1 Tax=Adineta steineri TaxID=433720 RepID=A0A819VET5_9BILA|nr:unnamed protein product [Adineta steineri]